MRIDFTLLADGLSDRVLLRIAEWVFQAHLPPSIPIRGELADLSGLPTPPRKLRDRISTAIEYYPCNVFLIHRDAEAQDPSKRRTEIEKACSEAKIEAKCRPIFVVPVRMTEAWLLFDQKAIRRAAGNPNGSMPLTLPQAPECESDPKGKLLDALREASGLKGRRRRAFRPEQARVTLANLIDDFAPLRNLCAFQLFENDIKEVLKEMLTLE